MVCGRSAESIIQEDGSPKEDLEKPPNKRARISTTDEVSANPLVPNEVAVTIASHSKSKSDDKDTNSATKEQDLVKRPNKRTRSSATDEKSESPPIPKRVVTGTSRDLKSEHDEEDTSSSDGAFLSEIRLASMRFPVSYKALSFVA